MNTSHGNGYGRPGWGRWPGPREPSGLSDGLMQTADKRSRLFERSEFLGRPPCILSALDRLAYGIGHLLCPGRV